MWRGCAEKLEPSNRTPGNGKWLNHFQKQLSSFLKLFSFFNQTYNYPSIPFLGIYLGEINVYVFTKTYPLQRHPGASNKPCVHQDTETLQKPSQNCMWVSPEGQGPQWPATGAGAPGAMDLGMASALFEVVINPTIELPELTQDWGNRLWEGTNRTSCAPGPRRKRQWPHKRLILSCLWVPRSFRGRRGLRWPVAGLGALSVSVCMDLLKEVTSISIQFSSVPLLAIPWTAACQASLSITNSWSLLKLMSIALVMPSNH